MKLSKKDEARIAGIVSAIGGAAREKIRTLPKDQQDLAWSAVAAGVVGAAIHDAQDPSKVFGFIKDTANAMMVIRVDQAFPDDDDLEAYVDAAIKEGRA